MEYRMWLVIRQQLNIPPLIYKISGYENSWLDHVERVRWQVSQTSVLKI